MPIPLADLEGLLEAFARGMRKHVEDTVAALEPHADIAPHFAMLLENGQTVGMDLTETFETPESAARFLGFEALIHIHENRALVAGFASTCWMSPGPDAAGRQRDRLEAVRVAVAGPTGVNDCLGVLERFEDQAPDFENWQKQPPWAADPILLGWHDALLKGRDPVTEGRPITSVIRLDDLMPTVEA
jgi:hypothetical protein